MISLNTNLFTATPPVHTLSLSAGRGWEKCPEQFAINFPLWVSPSHPCWAANYSNLVPTTSTTSSASTRLHNLKLQDFSVLAHGDSIGVNPRLMGSKDKYEIQSRRKKTCQILQGYIPGYNIPLHSQARELEINVSLLPPWKSGIFLHCSKFSKLTRNKGSIFFFSLSLY